MYTVKINKVNINKKRQGKDWLSPVATNPYRQFSCKAGLARLHISLVTAASKVMGPPDSTPA